MTRMSENSPSYKFGQIGSYCSSSSSQVGLSTINIKNVCVGSVTTTHEMNFMGLYEKIYRAIWENLHEYKEIVISGFVIYRNSNKIRSQEFLSPQQGLWSTFCIHLSPFTQSLVKEATSNLQCQCSIYVHRRILGNIVVATNDSSRYAMPLSSSQIVSSKRLNDISYSNSLRTWSLCEGL